MQRLYVYTYAWNKPFSSNRDSEITLGTLPLKPYLWFRDHSCKWFNYWYNYISLYSPSFSTPLSGLGTSLAFYVFPNS